MTTSTEDSEYLAALTDEQEKAFDAQTAASKFRWYVSSDVRIIVQVKPPMTNKYYVVDKDAKWFMGCALTLQVLRRVLARTQDQLNTRMEKQKKHREVKLPAALLCLYDKLVRIAKRDHKRVVGAIETLEASGYENFYGKALADLGVEDTTNTCDCGRPKPRGVCDACHPVVVQT